MLRAHLPKTLQAAPCKGDLLVAPSEPPTAGRAAHHEQPEIAPQEHQIDLLASWRETDTFSEKDV